MVTAGALTVLWSGALQPIGEGVFAPRLRRFGVLYVCLTLPLVAVIGGFAQDEMAYRQVFVLWASGLYTTPALVVAWLVIRRAPLVDRRFWVLWFVGLVLIYATGLSILAGGLTGWEWGNGLGVVAILVIAALFSAGTVGFLRRLSGGRHVCIDVADCAMALVVVGAPAILLWGEAVVRSENAWYAVPAGLTAVGMIAGIFWTFVLLGRTGPARSAAEVFGIALTSLGGINAAAQTGHAVSGFDWPPMPLLALHAVCMSLLLLVPLHLPRRTSEGLGRLPLQAQVRRGSLTVWLMLIGLPMLFGVTLTVRDERVWATDFALAAVGVLLLLAAARQRAAVRETNRLYARVERASDERRELLARMIRRMDDDRHAVAAQLHEQAVSAYATFVSFIQATSPPRTGPGGATSTSVADASTLIRDDLAGQADSLRQLMLAIRPLSVVEADQARNDGLTASVRAYLDNLYGDAAAPHLEVSVDSELVLDWITETIVLRIVQEAVRNVWRHSQATRVDVWLRVADGAVEVRVEDDGVGFDPAATLYESGISAMRSFATFGGGRLELSSTPGAGTVVSARLGQPVPDRPPADHASRRPTLRLIHGGAHPTR